MGAEAAQIMRVVLCIAFLVFAVACVSETSAISFDELVSRAEEAQHPKPVKAPPPPDPDMEEWSTDHLLGLDEPPPSDMFDDLVEKPHKKHVVHKKAHVVHKKVHHVVKKHKVLKKKHKVLKKKALKKKLHAKKSHQHAARKAREEFAENLLGSLPRVDHEKTGHSVSAHLGRVFHKKHHKKVHKKIHHKKVHKKKKPHHAVMLSAHKHLKKPHKKVHKKKDEDHEMLGSLGQLKEPEDDEVPESEFEHALKDDDDIDEADDTEVGSHGLAGLAGSMLQESDKRDQKERAAREAKEEAQKKQEQEEEEEERKHDTGVHLALSDDEPVEEDEDAEKDLPSLDSFFDDDDDE